MSTATAVPSTTQRNTPKELGFTRFEAAEIGKHLNLLLANYQVFFHKLQNYHWNVRGAEFYELHEVFETMYREAFETVDTLAERIRVFGQTPASTMTEYLELADLSEGTHNQSGEFMVRELRADIESMLANLITLTDRAGTNGDTGTVHLASELTRKLEKHHWMMTAYLSPVGPAS